MPRTRALFFVVQALQIFFVVFSLPESWKTGYVAFLLELLDFSFVTRSLTALYVTFGLVSCFVVGVIVTAIVVTVLFQKDDVALMVCLFFPLRASFPRPSPLLPARPPSCWYSRRPLFALRTVASAFFEMGRLFHRSVLASFPSWPFLLSPPPIPLPPPSHPYLRAHLHRGVVVMWGVGCAAQSRWASCRSWQHCLA